MLICAVSCVSFAQNSRPGTSLTAPQIQAVVVAVEDEIYDRGLQKQFWEVGAEPSAGITRLPLYIEPALKGGEGSVIYKLMPIGEVIRGFHFDKRGLAVLEGDPSSGFPPTDPNTLTLYMNDDDVCRWKHDWLRKHFDVLDNPPVERIREAIERQKTRVGYSATEVPEKSVRKFPPRN